MPDRVNKLLALYLGISRREADNLIADGRVQVSDGDDRSVITLGKRVESNSQIFLDGELVQPKKNYTYIALNKPVGYVSSRRRQGDTPTLYELLPEEFKNLKTVGRLDKNSSGLLILTDDGNFTYKMTHPKFVKTKIYEVVLDKELEPLHQQMISDFGIDLPDGRSKLLLEKIGDSRLKWQVTMSEGRNRQIRRTFAALGYEVAELHRTKFGDYELSGLEPGAFVEFKVN